MRSVLAWWGSPNCGRRRNCVIDEKIINLRKFGWFGGIQHTPKQLHYVRRPALDMFCITLCGPRTKNLETLGLIIPPKSHKFEQKSNANFNFFSGICGVGCDSWFQMCYRLFLTCVCGPGWKQIHRQINSIGAGLKRIWGIRRSIHKIGNWLYQED